MKNGPKKYKITSTECNIPDIRKVTDITSLNGPNVGTRKWYASLNKESNRYTEVRTGTEKRDSG